MISGLNLLRQFWGVRLLSGKTDSQAAANIIEVGSIKLDLHRLAIKISSVVPSTIFVWRCNGFHDRRTRKQIISVDLLTSMIDRYPPSYLGF